MDLNTRRILIVDDNEIDSFILERVLADTLFDCQIHIEDWAEDGLTYLQKVSLRELPEVIFLDINMPAMNGFEFMAEFAKLPDSIKNYSKVVLVTTSNHPLDRERAMSDPLIFGYLLKPVSVEKLNEILKSVSPAKSA
jgi:CheY-like chemotaxis protein